LQINFWLRPLLVVLVLDCVAAPCLAAEAQLPLPPLLDDARLYVTSPLRWQQRDWLQAGGLLLTIATSHQFDARVRQHFDRGVANELRDTHGNRDWLPALAMFAGTAGLAWVSDDDAGIHETRNMAEAGAFSVVSAVVFKQVAGRARPVAGNSNDWFKGGDAFPSTHVTAAMAIGTVLAESGGDDYRWVRRGLGYGLGAATMYARVKHQQHWASDTVAGAALGWSTARFVLHRHPSSDGASLLLMPTNNGVMLSYSVALR
jgi:membrane-associated phospholipid phosphatase